MNHFPKTQINWNFIRRLFGRKKCQQMRAAYEALHDIPDDSERLESL